MPRSMTGYGTGESSGPRGRLRADVRCVNGRFLEIRIRTPAPFSPFEQDLRQRLGESFRRGRVDLTLSWEPAPTGHASIRVNAAAAKSYLEAALRLRADLGLRGEIDLSDLLSLPGVVETIQLEDADPELRDLMLEAVSEAARKAGEMREVEGEATASDISARLERLAALREAIATIAEGVPAAAQKKLQERLARLGVDPSLDPGRLAMEVAYIADKSDIAEELARLEAHLARCREMLARKGEAVGKALEFLVQEMHREANTIGSKTSDLALSARVLEVKTEIERVREQVLNLE